MGSGGKESVIPVSEPCLGEEDASLVLDCVRSGWVSSKGDYIDRFEAEFSRFCQTAYGVSTTSGTTALHLALAAAGIGPGDEVIMPTFTMVATAFAAIYLGAKPVLADCEPGTWNLDVAAVEAKITPRTRAIMPVHIYGHPVDMDPLLEIARRHNLLVIEDAAEAHGAEYKGRRAGGLGDIGCFSFYANKIVTTGEGGMVVTNSQEIYERAKSLKDLGHSKQERFRHEMVAFNYRMTNLQAALGVAQMKRVEEFIERKRRMASLYNQRLSQVEGLLLPVEKTYAKGVYWMYGVVVEDGFGLSRHQLQRRLLERGIETRSFFIPMHRQPVFATMGLFRDERYPVSEYITERGLYLPSGLTLTQEQIERVCQALEDARR